MSKLPSSSGAVQVWKARVGRVVRMGESSGELKLGAVLVLVTKVF